MICCAVGIWLITERKREKNSVATSKTPSANRLRILFAIRSACSKDELTHAPELDEVDDVRRVERLNWS